MSTILRYGTIGQKDRYLPGMAAKQIRFKSLLSEPDAGSDSTRIAAFECRAGDEYIVSESKIRTSGFQHSDLLPLLVRTILYDEVTKK